MKRFSQDYIDNLIVRMAYHNSAIEGNTISLDETIGIILENITPSEKNINEFYEIVNHKQVLQYIFKLYMNSEELSVHLIKEIHSLLLDRLQHDKGQFKEAHNIIVGANYQTATPEKTPTLMNQWIKNVNYQLEHAKNNEKIIRIFAESHIKFEHIHPFSDGNGRVGRLILMYQSLQKFDIPLVIRVGNQTKYMEALANQDISSLTKILQNSIITEEKYKF